jgi:hypothetical protein
LRKYDGAGIMKVEYEGIPSIKGEDLYIRIIQLTYIMEWLDKIEAKGFWIVLPLEAISTILFVLITLDIIMVMEYPEFIHPIYFIAYGFFLAFYLYSFSFVYGSYIKTFKN